MSFRFVKFYALFLAGLMPGVSLWAQTNSAPAEQPIIFSSPDGESVSNALLPAVEAPEPVTWANLPDERPASINYMKTPARILPRPARIQWNNSQSLLDEKDMKLATQAQIMGIPSVQEIFGLPKSYDPYDQKNTVEEKPATVDKLKGPDISGSFFDGAPDNAMVKDVQDKYQDASVFSSSTFGQTPVEQAAFSPADQLSKAPMLASAPAFSQNTALANSAFSQGLNSASPFAVPGSSTLPQLPSVRAFQNSAVPAPAPAPSWMPKPAPWLSQVPTLGTMEQRKF